MFSFRHLPILVCTLSALSTFAADRPADTESKKPLPYEVVVHAEDDDVQALLTQHLGLIKQREMEDLDAEQIGFLAEDAPNQAQEMLETLGYFNSTVSVQKNQDQYDVYVTLGPRVNIEDVVVLLEGAVVEDDNLGEYYRKAMSNWALPVGDPYNQGNWDSSKTAVLRGITQYKYPLAQLKFSQAYIDPEAQTAQLNVTVDSNEPVYFGDIQVSGTERYPESVVRGLADFRYGHDYDLEKILDYQEALEQDNHYSNVVVNADFDNLQERHVPIKVNVVEVPRQKLELGVKYDTNEGIGTHFGYDHYNMFKRGYVGSIVADLSKYEQSVGFGVSQPRNEKGYYHTAGLRFKNTEIQKVKTKTANVGLWRVRHANNIDAQFGLEYYLESASIDGGPKLGNSRALLATAMWKQQTVTTRLRPLHGYTLEGSISSTLGTLASTANIQRANARASYYFTPENAKLGTVVLRAQAGIVHTKDEASVPTDLLFRTGGSGSVRGYEYLGIGIDGPNGSVLGGKVIGVASFEYQYPMSKNLSLAVFQDMGDVTNKAKDFKLRQATGLGLRWFSPVAPVSFDIARAHDDNKIRWHISLGTTF
ncbi:MAG: outer membrane protein assembly factor [Neisseriaceae bacterium]|nr:outer membrane protein assembly factor [Neisseriaceae bacterium]MBP6863096.1 outer membrane protein assembly factor [Neisseriaceae bacterium]